VIGVSPGPALEVGEPGSFDSQGVVPTAIVQRPEGMFLYYAGYQIPNDVRFLVLGGLAVSQDGGRTFTRRQRVPVMERTDAEPLFRVPHTVFYDQGVWRCWYGGGSHFIQGANKTLPVYDIRHIESPDGIHFGAEGRVCLTTASTEHRLGRPFVLKHGGLYKMFYGYGTEATTYRLGYAESTDGLAWVRKDDKIGLDVSAEGWDSEMAGYPCVVTVRDRVYLFYNGNGYGRDGFGGAVLLEW
jgi:glycosyl hydrolase family 32